LFDEISKCFRWICREENLRYATYLRYDQGHELDKYHAISKLSLLRSTMHEYLSDFYISRKYHKQELSGSNEFETTSERIYIIQIGVPWLVESSPKSPWCWKSLETLLWTINKNRIEKRLFVAILVRGYYIILIKILINVETPTFRRIK